MSLQVWLPLNGSLQNKGLDGNFSTTTSSITFSDNGKIGKKCLTSQISSITIPSMQNKKQMSFAYWVKIITATSTDWLDSFRWYSTDGTTSQSSRQEFYTDSTKTGIWFKADSSGINSVSNKPNVVGQWRHYAATLDYQTGDVKFYINGSLVGSTKSLDTTHYIMGTSFLLRENSLDHAISDFRLYDHILSLKEIKQISKGLVLHYPLDNNELGNVNPNLLKNSALSSNFTSWSGNTSSFDIVEKEGYSCAHIHFDDFNQSKYISCYHTQYGENGYLSPYNGLQLTFSADVLFENVVPGTTNYYIALYKSGTTIDGTWRNPSVIKNSGHYTSNTADALRPEKLNGKGWTKVWISMRFGDYNWPTSYRMSIYARDFTGDFYIKNVKIEEGTQVTSWCPNEQDSQYTLLGYNDTIVYDCSGYQNNGIANNITYSSGSPKYSSCANFVTAKSSYVKTSQNNWMADQATQMTINCWAYEEDWTAQTNARLFSCTQSGGFNTETGNSGYLRFPVYVYTNDTHTGKAYKYSSNEVKLSDLTPGWHMFTFIYDSTGNKVYIDGKYHSSYAFTSYGVCFNFDARLFLGCEASTSNPTTPYREGKQSDFRIYYTALSEEDIKQLYQIKAITDRNSNYFTSGKVVETLENVTKVARNGNSISYEMKQKRADLSTLSGPIISINDGGNNIPIDNLIVNIEPVQDLHGYDYPWAGGGRANQYNGEYISISSQYIDFFGTRSDVSTYGLPVKGNTTYVVSIILPSAPSKTWGIYGKFSYSSGTETLLSNSSGATHTFTFTPTEDTKIIFWAYLTGSGSSWETDGVTVSNIKTQVEVGTEPTDWVPYSNICPIIGYTGAVVTRTGKNLINDLLRYPSGETACYIGADSNAYTIMLKAGTYTISVDFSGEPYGMFYRELNDTASRSLWNSGVVKSEETFTIDADGLFRFWVYRNAQSGGIDISKIIHIQIELGSTATAYEPYQGVTIPKSWQTEAGTVYGGTLDVTSGVLTVDRQYFEFLPTGKIDNYFYTTLTQQSMPAIESLNAGVMCDRFEITNVVTPTTTRAVITFYANGIIRFVDPKYISNTVEEYVAAMGSDRIKAVYKLASSFTIQLTPQELTTLLGENHIWADTGDVAVTYGTNSNKISITREKILQTNAFIEN